MSGNGIPAVLMRGGTSKGVFLHARDLPPAGPERDALVLDLLGSPDPMQIDGLGGTYSSTSKVMVVDLEADGTVAYWFGQVGIDTPTVDWKGNCGNLTTAVAAFAVDEGLVPAVEPVTRVRMINGNTGVRIDAEVPVRDGHARVDGEQRVAGVPRPGAPIATHYLNPGGAVTGRLLPTGRARDVVELPDGPLELSLVDVTTAYVFVRAADLGVVPHARTVAEWNADRDLLHRIETAREAAAQLLGVVEKASDAAELSPVVPRIVLVGPPSPAADLEVVAVSMGAVHRAAPMTAALCLAAAVRLPGTLPREYARVPTGALRIGHPLGTVDVLAEVRTGSAGTPEVASVGVVRTARRLMKGVAYPAVPAGEGAPR
ncbi:PrpF domain-containing protein [Nocardia sp. BMG111209]|uniref:PrpF domain-containing protein n=1 Tax=Nocardia sp. BMG111209 TaxID=1160137 RepID=UPI00035C3DDD|nr:PrpF domain-containing protein [Nocardia sp. BMG111209]